jgi:hypothetical protein
MIRSSNDIFLLAGPYGLARFYNEASEKGITPESLVATGRFPLWHYLIGFPRVIPKIEILSDYLYEGTENGAMFSCIELDHLYHEKVENDFEWDEWRRFISDLPGMQYLLSRAPETRFPPSSDPWKDRMTQWKKNREVDRYFDNIAEGGNDAQ